MTDLDPITSALTAILGAVTARAPDIARAVPRLVGMLTGRRAQDASTRLTEAQTDEAKARAEQTAAEMWRVFAAEQQALAAELRAQHRHDRDEDAARCRDEVARVESDCERRADERDRRARDREAQQSAQIAELGRKIRVVAWRAGVAGASSPDLEPLDASVTPVEGVRVGPRVDDEEPTPDLPAVAPTDPPER